MKMRTMALFVFGFFLLSLNALESQAGQRHPIIGDGKVFAQIPEQPGFPEGVAIGGGKIFVSGPARFGTAETGPSKIYVYNLFILMLILKYRTAWLLTPAAGCSWLWEEPDSSLFWNLMIRITGKYR